jgi:DNA topoisomerase-2
MSKKLSKSEPSIEQKYQKLEHREHVLKRPGMYIGSIQRETSIMDIYDDTTNKIIRKEMKYTPGFYKTFDEVLVNAFDHTTREAECKTIKMFVSQKDGLIKVWNDGPGIPVTIHKEHKIYIPEMIFGNLLSSSNYYNDDDGDRVTSGLNGLGIKLCNIYSTKFIIETMDDVVGKKKYIQEFRNNMTEKDEPILSKMKTSDKPYTSVSYYPDFEKFKMDDMTDNDVAWMKKRAYDIAACTRNDIKVYFNNEEIKVKTFEDYINLCYDETPILVYSEFSDRWKVGCVFAPDNGNHQTSFVNGTSTYEGGSHVEYILDQIVSQVTNHIKLKHKIQVRPILIKEHLDIFVDATIVNPEFPSQTKSKLTTKPANFGSKCEVSKTFMDALLKTKLVELVVQNAQFKEQTALNKTDGKKLSMINIPKLEDARWAGTRKSPECRLFLTEGDSAFSYFKAGLAIIGRERYGGFPLRGKLLNVRNATVNQIKNNEEFIALKQIMGLKQDHKYTDTKGLRYGGIVILTDQDGDGSHIKGLIINLFQYLWPELLKIKGFIQTLSTILVRVWKKTDKAKKNPFEFYSEVKFEEWAKTVDITKYDVKYYKGLGTSDDKTARKSFVDFDDKVVSFIWENGEMKIEKDGEKSKETKKIESCQKKINNKKSNQDDSDDSNDSESESESDEDSNEENDDDSNKLSPNKDVVQKGGEKAKKKKGKKGKLEIVITDPEILYSDSYNKLTLAFDETRADDRKGWLTIYDKHDIIEYDKNEITYSEFVDKDLKHFSNYDNIRSIPSLIDGLKPSQRKIMYVCLVDNIKKDIKVVDLASEVSKRTAYKHGNTSLEETIIGLAQDFPGSNNINLLYPNGNFGHRWCNGGDSASSRYIFTFLENVTQKIFMKEDNSILKYLHEDGKPVEPETYYPILPMVLINGASGIGTGFATTIPQYNPIDICDNILRLMNGENMKEMVPWYNGFKGQVEKEFDGKTGRVFYRMTGIFATSNDKTLTVSEIPLGTKQSLCPRDYENTVLRPMAGLAFAQKEDKKDQGKKKKKDTEQKKKKEVSVIINKYFNNSGNDDVNFEIEFLNNEMQKLFKKNEIIEKLKLTTTIALSNMYLYNTKGILEKYESPLEILKEFYGFRLEMYVKRKAHYMKFLINELEILKYKVKYIKDVLDDKVIVAKKKRDEVIEQLAKGGYPKLSKNLNATNDEKSYDYLASMLLWSLTSEKIEELQNEYDEKKKEYDDYNSTTEIELWKREIVEFKTSYAAWLKEKSERNEDDDDTKKKKKKSKK